MLIGDFLSLVQLGLPVKVVVFNNGALGFIELEEKSSGFLPFGTEFKNPNFTAMGEAIGVRGIRLENPAEVDAGITEAFAHDGPVLLDAVVNRTELAMPPAVTLEMAKADLVLLLHRNRDVCVPGDVNLVANLDLIEHSRIDDMSAVFPSVRTNEGD